MPDIQAAKPSGSIPVRGMSKKIDIARWYLNRRQLFLVAAATSGGIGSVIIGRAIQQSRKEVLKGDQDAYLSKPYDYYLACHDGHDTDEIAMPQPATLLIGGAEGDTSGEDGATRWFLEQARHGKYLVLRVGGIGSQAEWICQNYSDRVHSAAELSIDSREAANRPEVVDFIRQAGALFIAGGDQNAYRELWEGTQIEDAINDLINTKHVPIAATSAGTSILCGYYYAPEHQGVLSSEILNDPFHYNTQTIHRGDFLKVPGLERVIIDTHLDRTNRQNPETRYGRLLGLLARVILKDDSRLDNYAIGLEEGAFVAIDSQGIARVFGNSSQQGQDAYFLKPNRALPEQMEPGRPLVWDNDGQAVKVYRISGTPEGSGSFDLSNWTTASGGTWEYWYTTGGISGLKKVALD
jgi:cyanophycinase-like exopeptidase